MVSGDILSCLQVCASPVYSGHISPNNGILEVMVLCITIFDLKGVTIMLVGTVDGSDSLSIAREEFAVSYIMLMMG